MLIMTTPGIPAGCVVRFAARLDIALQDSPAVNVRWHIERRRTCKNVYLGQATAALRAVLLPTPTAVSKAPTWNTPIITNTQDG